MNARHTLRLDPDDPLAAVELVREARRRGDDEAVAQLVDWLRDAVLDERPSAFTAWTAWARLLEVRGDERGELFALAEQARSATGRAAERLVDRMATIVATQRPGWCAPALYEVVRARQEGAPVLRWQHGFIVEASLNVQHSPAGPAMRLLEALLAAPAAELLRTLRLGFDHDTASYGNVLRNPLEVLVERAPGSLRRLALGRTHGEGRAGWLEDLRHTVPIDLDPVLDALPRLKRLTVGVYELVPARFEHAALETLGLGAYALSYEALAALAASALPALRRLVLGCGQSHDAVRGEVNMAADVGALERLLEGRTAPVLRELVVDHLACADALVRRLATSPLLAGLEVLELRRGSLGEATARFVVHHAPAFAHLRALRFDVVAAGAARAELVAALPQCELV